MDFNPEYNNLIIHKIYFNFIYSLIFIFTLCCLKYLYDINFLLYSIVMKLEEIIVQMYLINY